MPELESNLTNPPSTRNGKTGQSDAIDPDKVRDAVCAEITDCLIASVLVTNAINILVSHKHTKSVDHIFRYLPVGPPTVAALQRGLIPTHFDGATLETLAALTERIEQGQALIGQTKVFNGQSDDLDSKELTDLAKLWRQVCALGIAALFSLERSNRPFWTTERVRTLDRLIELLGSARNGELPYLDVDGYPTIPHWAEQRQDRRRPVDLFAQVRSGSDTYSARVVDITHLGIGFDRVFGLRPGQRVVVDAEGDRRFEGVVTWATGGRAGLELAD